MKTIYLNKEFECAVEEHEDTVQSIETNFFDGKCSAFIEGYRFVPEGQTWTRSDGVAFTGEMIAPFKDYTYLEMVQNIYEEIQLQIKAAETQVEENLGE